MHLVKCPTWSLKKKSIQVVVVVSDLKTSINIGMLTFKFLLCPLALEFRRESPIPSFLELIFLKGWIPTLNSPLSCKKHLLFFLLIPFVKKLQIFTDSFLVLVV